MTRSPADEMRSLLRKMNRLENRVLSLQHTIASFRSDIEQQIGDVRSGSIQDFTAHLPARASFHKVSRESIER